LVASTAYLDASAFYPADGDICQTINTVLTTYVPYAGAVVDARGILPTSGDTLQCSINPFSGVAVPSTVLLPAANIQIKDTWVLPSNTRIVGGDPLPATTYATLQVQTIFSATNSTMIQMCASTTAPCSGVSVEHLTIDGEDSATIVHSLNGIYNLAAQDQSYVNDVKLNNIALAGVLVGPNAQQSGAYSNIYVVAPNPTCAAGSCPQCVVLQAQTRGIHGASCIGSPAVSGTQGNAAISVQASNNSVKDVHIEAFWDGVQVGSTTSTVQGVAIGNITAASNPTDGRSTNAVHICGTNPNNSSNVCFPSGTPEAVSDVSVVEASINAVYGTSVSAIRDDVTATTIAPPSGSTHPNWTVGAYILGDPVGGGTTPVQYSRFSTNPAGSHIGAHLGSRNNSS
jgi:hypothetical protein